MVEPTLEFIGRQLERLIGDVATIRDDITVVSAMALRLNNRMDALERRISDFETVVLAELRSLHNHMRRMDERIRKLEDAE